MQVSASECIVSASIEAEPVMRKAASLVAVMPRLAASAAMTARRLPSSPSGWLMTGLLPGRAAQPTLAVSSSTAVTADGS